MQFRPMIRIPARRWQKFQRIGAVLALPAIALIVFGRELPASGLLEFFGYTYLLLLGLCGVSKRLGWIKN